MCDVCIDEEQDDFIEGRPPCLSTCFCKNLNNKDAKKAGIDKAPPMYLAASGLGDLFSVIQNLAWLDVDNNNLPTLRALSWFDIETSLETKDFLECFGRWLQIERSETMEKRKNK